MQQRLPPRPRVSRTPSGKPADPRLTGRFIPPHIPPRSTKVSEKLVLLPETVAELDEKDEFALDDEAAPPRDDEMQRRPGQEKAKSYAERLPKSRRTEKDLARVTAYCTAQAYKMQSTAAFIKDRHGARTKLYDDCLYTAYHLPLLPGTSGFRVRCSPPLTSAAGKGMLDEAIEQSERRDYHGAYYAEDEERHSVRDESPRDSPLPTPDSDTNHSSNHHPDDHRHSNDPVAPGKPIPVAEMFVFSYGVVVFWNFSEKQEKDVLADLTFSASIDPKTQLLSPVPLATNPLKEDDFETEEFHFEYNASIPRPRVYNDMITLRSGDHMIKLAISHAIAQSTKLSYFEERMNIQMEEARDVPKRLALTGELGMRREDIVKILGGLFKSRVDVNLCKPCPQAIPTKPFSNCLTPTASKVLDVPPLIWDSEPTLHPLYTAIREYLEIKPRCQVLNERCRVFLDLAEILSEYISDNKMSRLTWIIIVLILISILVTCTEVFLRFGILSSRRGGEAGAKLAAMGVGRGVGGSGELRLYPRGRECLLPDL